MPARRVRAACLVGVVCAVCLPATMSVAGAVGTSAVATVGLGADGPCGGEVVAKSDGTPWTCTFDDEFAGTTLDTNNWLPQLTANSQYSTGPTGSRACYTDSAANISVANGYLNLTARKEATPFTCVSGTTGSFTTQYTSGMVTSKSKFSQEYGRFEARAKLPPNTAKGLQETLWLYPTNPNLYGPWPQSGEIDFAEMYSVKYSRVVPYIHYQVDSSATNTATNTNVVTQSCAIKYGAFNTYVVVWQPGTITIDVNGTTCLIDNYVATGLTPPAPFDQNFVIALTQALGIGTNAFNPTRTKLPATTQIDYVRAWA